MRKTLYRWKTVLMFLMIPLFGSGTVQEIYALTFIVTSDNHSGYNDSQKALWQAITPHGGAFAITTGDVGSVKGIRQVINESLGNDYPWYVAVGNHDLRSDRMAMLRALNPGGNDLPNIVNQGPPNCMETTYSFRYENCHFVILNLYYDGQSDIGYQTSGANGKAFLCDTLYDWLTTDLETARSDPKVQHIFVCAHEPLYYVTDQDDPLEVNLLGKYDLGRHPENRDRLWSLMKQKGVLAFFCGHHHQFRVHRMDEDDVWQVLSAWGRGCDPPRASERWKHVKSTFVKMTVNGDTVSYEAYRGPRYGGPCTVPYAVAYSDLLVTGQRP